MNNESQEAKQEEEFDSEQIYILNNLNDMLANYTEVNKVIEKYKECLKEFFIMISNQYNRINELYYNYFESESKDQIFVNTPIFKLGSFIKNMIQLQLKNYDIIISKGELFNLIDNKISRLQMIIEEASSECKNISISRDIYKETNNIFGAMMNIMKDLEIKAIDEYIWEKYKKRASEAGEKKAEDLVSDMKNLEKNIRDFVEEKKKQYYSKLKVPYDRIQATFNELKNYFLDYGKHLKDMNENLNSEIEKLRNDINSNTMIKDANTSETNSGFNLSEKEFYTVKYKLKLLKNNIYALNPSQSQDDQAQNKENETKSNIQQKVKEFHDNNILLTEKDKYEIISKLYSYDLKILDKSLYVLDIEKGKFIALDLSHEILSYSKDNEETEKKLNEKYNEIIESMNNKIVNNIKNIESFFLALNQYRANGDSKLSSKFYDLVVYVYNKAQELLVKAGNKRLEDLMLILSRTFYKEIDGKKIYIVDVIKTHELYKKEDFWKTIIIKQIEDEFKVMRNFKVVNNTTNVLTQKRKEEIITTKLYPFYDLLKDYDVDKDKRDNLIKQILDKYKCGDESREQVFSFIKENQN